MNKTSTTIKKIQLIKNPPKKFRKTLLIERKNINIKNSFENSNKNDYSSENNSNINLKTAAQSNIISESPSIIRRAQTQNIQKIKKSFFAEEKENKKLNLKKSSKNNIKNEIIQCEPNNNFYLYKSKNIMKNNKELERMAKKLILKLNEEEYYDGDKTFKYLSGNTISFKNGFFNGINLVTNIENDKKKEFENNYNIFKTKSSKYNNNSFNSNYTKNNYNKDQIKIQLNKNLPLYLRDKANIQGTDVLSPLCKGARDEFLFNKIFNNGRFREFPKKMELINNKLNIFYAENENQYIKKLKKHNEKLKLKGKKIIHELGPTKDQLKLNRIKDSLGFIKKIIDYSYPIMVLSKVRKERHFDKRTHTQDNIPPYERADLLQKKGNDILERYLKMSISVENNNNYIKE